MDLFKVLKKVGGVTAPWGTMHIVSFPSARQAQVRTYAVTYARYDHEGGALRPRYFESLPELESFLRDAVQVEGDEIGRAIAELQADRTTSIQDIYLSEEQIDRLGLRS